MQKIIITIVCMLTGAVVISSCSSNKSKTEFEIIHNCDGTQTCEVELAQVTSVYNVDFTGKEHLLQKKVLKDTLINVTAWYGIPAYATRCGSGSEQCTATDNPTFGVFAAGSTVAISVDATITADGVQQQISTAGGGSFVVPDAPVVVGATLIMATPTGYTGADSGTLGTSGISYSVNGANTTFTCPSSYPNLVTGVVSPFVGPGAHVSGTETTYAYGMIVAGVGADGGLLTDTEGYYYNNHTHEAGFILTAIVCMPTDNDWVVTSV